MYVCICMYSERLWKHYKRKRYPLWCYPRVTIINHYIIMVVASLATIEWCLLWWHYSAFHTLKNGVRFLTSFGSCQHDTYLLVKNQSNNQFLTLQKVLNFFILTPAYLINVTNSLFSKHATEKKRICGNLMILKMYLIALWHLLLVFASIYIILSKF